MITHYFDGKSGKQSKVPNTQLLHATAVEYGSSWQSNPHSHIFTELVYILEGEGWFQLEEELVPVQQDDLILVNPQVVHQGIRAGNNGMSVLTLGLCSPCIFGSAENHYTLLSAQENASIFRTYMKDISTELINKSDNFEELCQKLTDVIILQLSRRCQHSKAVSTSRKSARECARVRLYIDEHFTEPLTLDHLAQYANLNKYYLVHVFNREMGCSPISYLIDRRIAESKRLLSSGNTPIHEISIQMGFSSPSYFSQSFRRSTGFSPAEYRRQTQNVEEKNSI